MILPLKPHQIVRCTELLVGLFKKAYPDKKNLNFPTLAIFGDGSGHISEWVKIVGMQEEREVLYNFIGIEDLIAHLQEKAGENDS